jgi:S1-C subfamily serine protease
VRDKLGLTVQNLSPELRRLHNVPEGITGILVTNVKNVSPAGDANINEGDVISEVQGQRVTNVSEFRNAIDRIKSGQRVRFYVTTSARGGQSISTYRIITAP